VSVNGLKYALNPEMSPNTALWGEHGKVVVAKGAHPCMEWGIIVRLLTAAYVRSS
jgi:hypothetical protein